MLTVIAATFYSRILDCIHKVNIYSSDIKVISVDPSLTNLSTKPQGKFMAAISVSDLNLADPQIKYFRSLAIQFIGTFQAQIYDQYDLEPCTMQHWQGSPQISDSIKLLDISKMMCLPKNMAFSVKGKLSSTEQRTVSLALKKIVDCDPNSTALPRCATEAQYRNFFGNETRHKIQLYFTNYHISPDKLKPINEFLDDRHFLYFTETIGAYTSIQFQDFNILTDESIIFNNEPKLQSGVLVDDPSITFTYLLLTRYAQFTFGKSLATRNYDRRFEKIDEVLSNAGGLFGVLCSFLLIVKIYNTSAFSISLAQELFRSNSQGQTNLFKEFSFFRYLKIGIHNFLQKIGFQKNWSTTIQYKKYSKQSTKNVDVVYLLKRLFFLQSAMGVILQDYQITGLHLRQKLGLREAQRKREFINLKKQVDKAKSSKSMKSCCLCLKNQNQTQKTGQGHERVQSDARLLDEIQVFDDKILISPDPKTPQNKIYHQDEVNINFEVNQNPAVESEQDSSKNSEEEAENRDKIVSELEKIKQEAKKGSRMSRRIMDLSGPALASVLKKLVPHSDNLSIPIQKSNEENSNFEVESLNENLKKTEEKHDQNQNKKQKDKKVQFNQMKTQKVSEQCSQLSSSKKQKVLNCIKSVIKQMDLFSAQKFFRYHSQIQYNTFFGGVVTIVIFIVLLSISYGKMMDWLNRSIIYSSEQKKFSTNPIFMKMNTIPNKVFMIDLWIEDLNLNHPNMRYFDFTLKNIIKRYDESTGNWSHQEKLYSMEKCTREHWKNFERFITNDQELVPRLCFPIHMESTLQGKKTSNEFHYLEFLVQKCKNQTNPQIPCNQNATNDYLTYAMYTNLRLRILNPVINHRDRQYIDYYLEERASFILSLDMINTMDVFFQDYTIITDESIFPWEDLKIQTGFMMTEPPLIKTSDDIGNVNGFGSIKFYKSFHSKIYHRSFQKLQEVFAFIGGLFRVIFPCLFMVALYNHLAYELTLSSKVFQPQKTQKNIFKKYNFLSFCVQCVYKLLSFFRVSPQWQATIEYLKCQEQMEKQLDVMYILKRLDFLQCSIETILENFEVTGLHLAENPSLDEAKEQRKAFNLKTYLRINNITKSKTVQEVFAKLFKKNENKEKNQNGFDGNLKVLQNNENEEDLKKEEQQLEEFQSSNSEDSLEGPDEDKNNRILENARQLDEEAQKGNKTSKKIKDLMSKDISEFFKQQIEFFKQQIVNRSKSSQSRGCSVHKKNRESSTAKKSVNPFILDVKELNVVESQKGLNGTINPLCYKRTLYPIVTSKKQTKK